MTAAGRDDGPIMIREADLIQPTADGQWGLGTPLPAAAGWSARKHVLVTIAIAVAAALAVGLGALLGDPAIGALAVALPAAVVVAFWPEIGVFLIVLYVPMEAYGSIQYGQMAVVSVTKMMAVYTTAVLLIHVFARRRGNVGIAALWLAIALAAWSGLTMMVARNPDLAALTALTHILLVGLMFVILIACTTREQFQALCWMIFLSAVMAATMSFFLTPEPITQMGRVTVGEINVNEHAQNLMGGVFMAPLLFGWSRRAGRWLVVAGLLIVLIGLVETGSRSVYAAVLAGLLAAAVVYRKISIPRRAMLAIGILVSLSALVLLGFALGIFGEVIAERVAEGWERGFGAGGRLARWRTAAEVAMDHPLMGIGPGQYIYYHDKAPHNDFLNIFEATGVPGLLLYVAFLVAVLGKAWRVAQPGLRAVLLGLFVAAFVTGIANPYYAVKAYWFHMSLCVLGGLLYAPQGRGRETAAMAEGAGPVTRVDAGSPVPMDRRV